MNNLLQNIKVYGLSGLLACSTASCETGLHGKKALDESKKDALETVDYKNLPVNEYDRLLTGEKQVSKSIWAWDNNVKAIRYWDSIKTDALVKKAYQEGAQMVRDSIAKANLQKIAADSLKHVK